VNVLAAPILIPLGTAALSLLAWQRVAVQRWLAVTGTTLLLVAALALLRAVLLGGIQSVQIGDWPAPFGITLVADTFSAVMLTVGATLGLLVLLYSLGTMDRERERWGYYPLYAVLLTGKSGAFLTGDVFNLFVWIEVMLIASFALMALGNHWRQLVGTVKYVAINLIASALLLSGIGILYGMTGTLNLADLAGKVNSAADPGIVTPVAVLFLVALGIKGAIFPLYFWLPDSYPTPPVAISTIFVALLTKVGIYAIVRLFTLVFVHDVGYTHALIRALAVLTMLTGALGAVSEWHFRRLLSFLLISEIGFLLLGLSFYTPLALAGVVFLFPHVMFTKSALFLVSGMTARLQGSYDVRRLGGLYATHPGLSILFLVPALSLAGVPPFSGFFAKLALVEAGLATRYYGATAAAIATGLLTLYSMAKIWIHAFWKPVEEIGAGGGRKLEHAGFLFLPVMVLALAVLLMGLAAGPLFRVTGRAAGELLDPALYIQAVLGAG
jgi:multicomponent Na+:H+ antiporter subunit D